MSATSSKKPTTLIIHGANAFGIKLTELLTSQRSNVLVIDEFTRRNKDASKTLKKDFGVEIFDISAIPSLTEKIKRVDYVFLLLDQFLLSNEKLSSKKFMSETNVVDAILKLSIEQGAKVVLTTSIKLHRQIVGSETQRLESLKDVPKQTPYTQTELQRYCENMAAEYHDQAHLDIRITRLGEMIGEGIPTDENTTLKKMILESISKPRITIPGEGLDYAYYVHILDAVYGVLKALFSNKTNGEVFSLSYQEEISSLNLAYKILEMNPKATEISFAEDQELTHQQYIYVPAKNLKKIGWNPKISFEQALLETMSYFHDQYEITWKNKPSIEEEQQKVKEEPKEKEHRSDTKTPFGKLVGAAATPFAALSQSVSSSVDTAKKKKLTPGTVAKFAAIGVCIVLVYFFLIGPIIQLIFGAGGTYYYGKKGYSTAEALDTQTAEAYLEKSTTYSALMQEGWKGFKWISYIPPAETFYNETATLISATNHLTTGSYYLIQGLHPYADYFKSFDPITSFGPSAGGGSREYLQELEAMEQATTYIERASVEISLARDGLEAIDVSVFPSAVATQIDALQEKTETADTAVTTLESFAFYLPDLLGKDGRQTYVILFQNPMELRSTGGWISSVGIVGIEHGQVRELTVEDVYEIDGQITEVVQPPESMQEALDINEWSLSLSNWYPDYPQSAESAEYFLKIGDRVVQADGVIAIDLEFVRDILGIWESIQVPGEVEPVTSDSLYDKVIEIHREFTPGSTQKPIFLSNLANEIIQKVLTTSKDNWPEIADKIVTNLDEKHILVYIPNTEVREVLDSNGWSGHITSEPNLLYPVEWNWGGNKANYFIARSTELTADIQSETTVQQTLSVSYQNNSTSNRYPEGDYVNYVRVYIPAESRVSRIEGLSTVRVSHDDQSDLDVVSGWITVPVKGRATYSITYQMRADEVEDFPLSRGSQGTIHYDLTFLKQPGLMADPLTIEVTYPEGWAPSDLTDIRRELNALVKQTQLETDTSLTLTWEK